MFPTLSRVLQRARRWAGRRLACAARPGDERDAKSRRRDGAGSRLIPVLRHRVGLDWTEVLVLGLALVLRLVLVHHATWLPVSDTQDYHVLAASIARTHSYAQLYRGESEEYQGMLFRAYRMPGYPAFLAALYSLAGWNRYYAYLANVVADLATMVLVLRLGRPILGSAPARAAQALVGAHALWTPNLMTESLFTALFTALVLMVVTDSLVGSRRGAFFFGLLLAAAVFVRPIALVASPIAFYKLLTRRGLRAGPLLALLSILPVLAAETGWIARNYEHLGAFVPLTTSLGPHNAKSFEIDRKHVVLGARRQGLNEVEINRLLLGHIRAAIIQEPLRAAGLYVRRALGLFSLTRPWEAFFLQQYTFHPSLRRGSTAVHHLYGWLYFQYYVTYPLALIGAVALARERRPLGGIWTILGSFILLHAVVSDGNLRFAAPLYPLLCLFAAHALFLPASVGARLRARGLA